MTSPPFVYEVTSTSPQTSAPRVSRLPSESTLPSPLTLTCSELTVCAISVHPSEARRVEARDARECLRHGDGELQVRAEDDDQCVVAVEPLDRASVVLRVHLQRTVRRPELLELREVPHVDR